MMHRQEDTCRLLQKWHVKCAGQDVDARDGEGLPLLQTPCGGWKNTLVDVTPCYSIHLLSLPAPSLCTPLKQHLWPRHGERDIGSGICWGTLSLPSTPPPFSRMKLFFCRTSKEVTSVYPDFFPPVFTYCIWSPEVLPPQHGPNELWLLIRPFDNIGGRLFYGRK